MINDVRDFSPIRNEDIFWMNNNETESCEYMKIIYVNCEVKNYMKVNHHGYSSEANTSMVLNMCGRQPIIEIRTEYRILCSYWLAYFLAREMNLLIVWKHETLWPRLYKRDRAPGTKSSSCWAEVQNTDSVISPKRALCVPSVLYRQRNRRWGHVGLDF